MNGNQWDGITPAAREQREAAFGCRLPDFRPLTSNSSKMHSEPLDIRIGGDVKIKMQSDSAEGHKYEVRSPAARSQEPEPALLLRREIPLARPHLQILLQRGNFDRAVSSVSIKIG